jgi:signal transduction histidine kinase
MLLAWGWLYRDRPVSVGRGLVFFGVEIALLLLLIWQYGAAFAWISMALLYPVIGRLPRRQLALPVAVLVLVFAAAMWPTDTPDPERLADTLNIVLQIALNIGIASGLRLISAQSDQLRGALAQLRQAHAELAASAAQQEELAVLRERARLARAMHDNLGHALVVMNVKLEAAQLLYARDPARGDAELEATRGLIREAMADLRRALGDLRAPASMHADLPAALEQLARDTRSRTGAAITCSIAPDLPALLPDAREAIWYVAREALANVERHANATSASIALEYAGDTWLLRVVDDGAGIQGPNIERPGHYGVVGMRERMKELGGTLHIQRGAQGGTILEARLPRQSIPEATIR